VEALQSLGRWSQQNNHRWIWVLDGLDRLAPDDQKALPWLPLTIPEGVVIVASGLECPAREILLERKFKTRTIVPLKAKEQAALIQQYLGRYTKQLIAELRQTILRHPLAGSPLFLRVLLEELRQCGRHETLAEQLDAYLTAQTIDDLYERVLERLEADGKGENVRKAMTALWASSAGLSEQELLLISDLVPLEWAPIDLALEEALGHNEKRLVFDHEYLRIAVQDRYLATQEKQFRVYREIGNAIIEMLEIDEASASNLIHCLAKGGEESRIAELLLSDSSGQKLLASSKPKLLLDSLRRHEKGQDAMTEREFLDLISERALEEDEASEAVLVYWAGLGELALQSGIPHKAASDCFRICCKMLERDSENKALNAVALYKKAEADFQIGAYALAEQSLRDFLDLKCSPCQLHDAWIRDEKDSSKAITKESCLSLLGIVLGEQFQFAEAEQVLRQAFDYSVKEYGIDHPASMTYKNNWLLAISDLKSSECESAPNIASIDLSSEHRQIYERRIHSLGRDHLHTLVSQNNLALQLFRDGDQSEALDMMADCLKRRTDILGSHHQHVMDTQSNLATFLEITGRTEEAISLRSNERALFDQMMPMPPKHLIQAMCVLVCSYLKCSRLLEANSLASSLGSAIDEMRTADPKTASLIANWWARMLAEVSLIEDLKTNEWQQGFEDISTIAANIINACKTK